RDVHDCAFLHGRNGLHCSAFVALLSNPLEYFVAVDSRYQQQLGILDCRREEARILSVGKVFEPARRVDKIHMRSLSRGTVESMPRTNPRSALAGLMGINSIRSPRAMTRIFCPAVIPRDLRTSRGMTTW